MANKCSICGKEMGRFERGEMLFGITGLCAKCVEEIQSICKHGKENQVHAYTQEKNAFIERHKASGDVTNIMSMYKKMDEIYELKDMERRFREEEERKAKLEELKDRLTILKDMPVSTVDINMPYEVVGPIIVNTTNKGVFSSAYSNLLDKYTTYPMNALLKMPLTESEKTGEFGTFLLSLFDSSFAFEGAVGQGSFDMAYYICVAELKLRCAEMGGDAIVGMHMDFDLDTTNWGGFYIQMHGTAVKLKDN